MAILVILYYKSEFIVIENLLKLDFKLSNKYCYEIQL